MEFEQTVFEQTVMAFAALSQPTRLQAFRTLVAAEPEGIAAGELARILGVPQNTLSSHLNVLVHAGLARGTRQSRSIIYRAGLDRLRETMLFLVEECCAGRPELCEPLVEALTPCCEKDAAHHD